MGERTGGRLRRRGLLAGAAALAAAGVSRLFGAGRADAGHTSLNDPEPLHIGVINDGTGASNTVTQSAITTGTVLTANIPNATNATLRVQQLSALPAGSGASRALDVYAAFASVTGVTAGQAMLVAGGSRFGGSGAGGLGIGAFGGTVQSPGTGAGGDAIDARGGAGLSGAGGDGVVATGGNGVSGGLGVSATGGNAFSGAAGSGISGTGGTGPAGATGGVGVVGLGGPTSGSPARTGVGVHGESTSGTGLYGLSQSGAGAFGGSNSSIGVYANSNEDTGVFATAPRRGVWGRTATGIGVFGQVTNVGGFAVYGAAPTAPDTWAGYFEGNVFVSGGLAQGGSGPVTSLAQGRDGSPRTLYSVDSAEPLVEDVGEGTLVGGKAQIKLDPELAAVVDGAAYQVFLTPEGDCKGLYVTGKTLGGFEVYELQGGTSSLPFGYRVVARRMGAAGKRLERRGPPRRLGPRDLEPPRLPDVPTRDVPTREPARSVPESRPPVER